MNLLLPAAAASVQACVAVEAAASAITSAAVIASACVGVDRGPVTWAIAIAGPITPARTIRVSRTAVVAAAIPSVAVESVSIISVKPGARADEHATYEVVGPVVAIGSACIRIVAVVTVSADRCRSDADRYGAYTYPHGNLCVCAACNGKKQNP
jgi:hypothetical protein